MSDQPADQPQTFVALPLEDGSYFQVRHLPWEVLEDLEKRSGISWLIIIDAPQVNGSVLADIARHVAVVNGELPPVIETGADLIAISNRVALVDADGRRVASSPAPTVAPDSPPLAWTAQE